jgi:hypothetical protein
MMNQSNRDVGRTLPAVILISLGVLFLFGQIFSFNFFGTVWPFLVVIPGLAFLYFAISGGRGTVGLAVPGAIITGTGAILFYQNITNHWESWAYVWTLYPVFVGMALTYIGQRTENPDAHRAGQGLVRWGLIAFVGAWAFFELIIFNGGGALGNFLLPALLIGVGVWLLFRRNTPSRRKVYTVDVPAKPKNTNGHYTNDDLQAKIDAALAEPDEPKIV